MAALSTIIRALPFMAAAVLGADFPPIPADLTTPIQQRLAVMGPNGVLNPLVRRSIDLHGL